MGTLLEAAKFGWQNPLCARWNSPEQLLNWREAWASAVNRALEEKQQSARVTHLSHAALGLDELKRMGVVLKRAQYFLTCSGRSTAPLRLSLEGVRRNLTATERASLSAGPLDQLSLFEPA